MPHRRPSRSRNRFSPATALRLPGAYGIESLEIRRLLTTVNGFGLIDQQTGLLAITETVFTDGEGNPAVIYSSDVTFEAIGAHRGTTTSPFRLSDLAPYPLPTGETPAATGTDVYKIYVTESDADSFIAITEFAPLVTGGPPFTLLPYAGSVGPVGVDNAAGVPTSELPSVGGILVGGVDLGPSLTGTPRPDLVISTPYLTPIGLQPVPPIEPGQTRPMLEAGIEVVPTNAATGLQNDFENFLVGGSVTGQVTFGANLNEFYAGGIFTGLSTGGTLFGNASVLGPITGESARPDPGNFTVAGDLRELVTAGQVGTDGAVLPAMYGNVNNDPGFYNYVSNFDLVVGGTLGEVHLGNEAAGFNEAMVGTTFAGTVEVTNDPTISGQTVAAAGTTPIIGDVADQTEVEDVALTQASSDFQQEEGFGLLNTPANQFEDGQIDFTNDSMADAQILGTIPEVNPTTGAVVRDTSGNLVYRASVDGQIAVLNGDDADYYGMALMAGTIVQVTLSDISVPGRVLGLAVYDPEGRLIESNSDAGDAQAIQVTADVPGIYYFKVSSSVTSAYNLTITGAGELGIGGIIIDGGYSDTGLDGGIALYAGDLGALELTGTYYSLTDGPTDVATSGTAPTFAPSSIIVAAGNLRSIVGGALGESSVAGEAYGGAAIGTVDPLEFVYGPVFNIPDGGIGLIQSTAGVLNFFSQFDPNALELATPEFNTNDAYAHAISGSIQVIDAATTFEAYVAVDAGIGSIRAGNMDTDIASYIDVNADNTGSDGIIDLIDVEGQLGNLGTGGPSIVTHTNGVVRYMVVNGPAFLPEQFGGVEDQAKTYTIGTGATLTDDAGNTVTLTPEGITTTVTGTGGTETQTGTTASGTTTTTTVNGTTTTTFSPQPGEEDTLSTTAGVATLTVTTGPQVSVLTYPVADKGGQILLDVSVANGSTAGSTAAGTTGTGGGGASLLVSATGADGSASEADISQITIAGVGRPLLETGTDQFGNITVTQPIPATASTTPPSTTGTSTATGTSGVGAIAAGTVTTTSSLTAAAGTDPTDLFLLIQGSAKVDVLQTNSVEEIGAFAGTNADPTSGADSTLTVPGDGVPVEIANTTGGELVSVDAPAVGTISVRGNLGFATPEATPAAVQPRTVVAGGNSYPFVQQHTAVELTGETTTAAVAVNINAGGALGNIITSGDIGNVVADAGNHPAAGIFAGIVGPVVANRILFAEVGQGLAPTGTGAVGNSGLFATDVIGEVTNGGVLDGDIRGDIVSLDIGNLTNSAIDHVQLGNASIVESRIYDLDGASYLAADYTTGEAFSAASDFPQETLGIVLSEVSGDPLVNATQYDIGPISVGGDGGILGSTILAGSIAPITVGKGGYGVLETTIGGLSAGHIGGISAAGYGVREVDISNGGNVGPINATGNGASIPVTDFPVDVRPSDVSGQIFDRFTGDPLSADNDLNAALGGSTSAAQPNVPTVTQSGVIEDLTVEADGTITGIAAQVVRSSLPVVSTNLAPEPAQANIPIIGTEFDDSLTTSGTVGYVRVRSLIDGLQITAGSIGQFTQTGDVNRLGIDVAGAIGNLTIHGNLGAVITDPTTLGPEADSYIEANGIDGHIDDLTVYGNLYADVFSSKYIKNVTVHGDLDGDLTNEGIATDNLGLGTLTVSGSIANGSLNITGPVGTITTGGSLGTPGQDLTIGGGINRLVVGTGRSGAADLALNLTVNGTVKSLLVNGEITGAVHVTGDLLKLQVNGNIANPAALSGALQVDENLVSATIDNGNVSGDVTANIGIGSFTVNRGSLLTGATLTATLGSIGSVRVIGGITSGIAGSIVAPNGTGLNVTTTGSFGNGSKPSAISALSAGTISIGGNVLPDATVSIVATLDNLFVGGNVLGGATIVAHPATHSRIRGTNAGTVTTS